MGPINCAPNPNIPIIHYYTCGPKLYRPIWLWAEIDMGRNCYGPKCPVTSLGLEIIVSVILLPFRPFHKLTSFSGFYPRFECYEKMIVKNRS